MFSNAIVRKPGHSLVNGLTSAGLGVPDFQKALAQHQAYIQALEKCGLEVQVLAADEDFPDSTFVEDVALLTPHCAIITNPGASSRKGETVEMQQVVREYYTNIEEVRAPGTVDAGDIMMVDTHYYIGLSERTDPAGAEQVISFLGKYGLSGSVVELKDVLHLKTGVAYLENNNLVVCGEFLTKPEFQTFDLINIPKTESYAANCIWVNDQVLIPAGFPKAYRKIEAAGYSVIELDMSEFQKLDGGLSCLSLRF